MSGLFDFIGGAAKLLGQASEAYVNVQEEKLAKEQNETIRKLEAKTRRLTRKIQMVNLALTCRLCKSLAPPIEGTGNRYRCECGNQFAGARHRL